MEVIFLLKIRLFGVIRSVEHTVIERRVCMDFFIGDQIILELAGIKIWCWMDAVALCLSLMVPVLVSRQIFKTMILRDFYVFISCMYLYSAVCEGDARIIILSVQFILAVGHFLIVRLIGGVDELNQRWKDKRICSELDKE
jgi:hypothetical protein